MIEFLTQRSVVVGLAIAGAVIVMLANSVLKRNSESSLGLLTLRLGYGITACSITLFIVAGFIAE